MINGKLFAKFQKLLPKMNKGLKSRNYAKDAFFLADNAGCLISDGFSLLHAPAEGACDSSVALTELPKAKLGAAVFVEAVDKHSVIFKDGGVAVNVTRDETGKESLMNMMRKNYVHDVPASAQPACITVNANALKNLLDVFDGNVRVEITSPEDAHCRRQIYLHDVSSGENLQAMLLPVRPKD